MAYAMREKRVPLVLQTVGVRLVTVAWEVRALPAIPATPLPPPGPGPPA